jgi:hypothetical protein
MDLQQLLTKLAQVRGLILTMLDQHQTHAQPMASYCSSRLAQFYSANTLASAVVVEVPILALPAH